MKTLKIFIASSSELSEERDKLETFIYRQNDRLIDQGIRLKTERWENFLDTISISGLQSEYNEKIKECNFVVCLFYTKVGQYTAEEFHVALKEFKETGEPKIWTYFKTAPPASLNEITEEINTVFAFQKELKELGHYYTRYNNYDNLINQLRDQLDKILPEYLETINKETSPPVDSTGVQQDKISKSEEPILENWNELLTKRLISAIQPFNKKANEFLVTYPDWETNSDLVPIVQQIIISGYVGVLGIQLRKLISIGKEKPSQSRIQLFEDRMNRYLENCQLTAKRALQLISYALLSTLWDHKINSKIKLSQSQTTSLIKFFKNTTEENIIGLLDLLRDLIEVFSENKLELPIPQLKDFRLNLQDDSEFIKACSNLHSITEILDNESYSIQECLEAETNIVVVLENLNFLAEYKMISIKDIGYNHQRNDQEGIYLHNYTLIEVGKTTSDQEKVRKESSPVISYAVLLYKKNYRHNINMVPFVIDYNALGLSGGSKIGFYSFCNTFDNLDLNYSFIDDNEIVSIKKSSNQKPDENDSQALNVWLAIKENRRDMNFDKIYDLFNQAKKALAGIEEERLEDIL